MSVKFDATSGAYAKPKYELVELEGFGKDIGRSLSHLLDKWKFDDEGNRKPNILRRISTKSKSLLSKKKKTNRNNKDIPDDEEEEESTNRIIQVPLAPPALTSQAPFIKMDDNEHNWKFTDTRATKTMTLPSRGRNKLILPNSLQMESGTYSDSEVVVEQRPHVKEEDTRTCVTEPDRLQKVEEWLNNPRPESQTCRLNTNFLVARAHRSKSLGRLRAPSAQAPSACIGPDGIGKGIKRMLFG